MRAIAEKIASNSLFQNLIVGLIILNGITMGLETSDRIMNSFFTITGEIIHLIDKIILAVFTFEITVRIYAYRGSFFKDPWSLFDLFVVAVSYAPSSGFLSSLRILRVLRLFRLITIIPQMRRVISALLATIPGISSIFAILLLFFYAFSIMATHLFSEAFPEWFGTMGESMYTLFQVMTLESWSMGIVRPIMEQFPNAWLFFVPFILVVTFIMVNLFVAVIIDAMGRLNDEEREEKEAATPDPLMEEIKSLKQELAEIKLLLREQQGFR